MPILRSPARDILLAVLTSVVAIVSALDVLGERLRMVNVLTIVLLSMAAGMAIARAIARMRAPSGSGGSAA